MLTYTSVSLCDVSRAVVMDHLTANVRTLSANRLEHLVDEAHDDREASAGVDDAADDAGVNVYVYERIKRMTVMKAPIVPSRRRCTTRLLCSRPCATATRHVY